MADRVLVAMSGGVDSSVAAALLVERGFDVIGVTLQLWGKDVCATSGTRLCCSVRDALDAKAVAKRLRIPHETLELAEAFRTHVIGYFVSSYEEGKTPNPCIACNDHIKFGELLAYADQLGARWIATGHYAQVTQDASTGRYQLLRATDLHKDQSYVLFNLTQTQLARVLLPLGELHKDEVRTHARTLGLATAEKPDSQDICFVRDRNKNGFLRKELGAAHQPGPITDRQGRVLGTHQGLLGYTIGQREGIGLSAGHPLYVLELDQANNRLIVGEREALLERSFLAERVNWVSSAPPEAPVRAAVQIRSRHEAALASITPVNASTVRIVCDVPQQAITPGQAAVFYDGARLLGGGWIAQVLKEAGDGAAAPCEATRG